MEISLRQNLMKILDYSQYIEGEPFYEWRPLGVQQKYDKKQETAG